MNDETNKEKNEEKYETEWSFSFGDLGDRIRKAVNNAVETNTEDLIEETFAEPLEDAKSAKVIIGGSMGARTITALEDSENLLEAHVINYGEVDFTIQDHAEGFRVLKLEAQKKNQVFAPIKFGLGKLSKNVDTRWEVGLSPKIPLELNLSGGVGPANFDLRNLRLRGIEIDGGVGETTLRLPASDSHYNVKVDSGIGNMSIIVEQHADITITIDGGVGNTSLRLPAGVPLRIEAEGGVGNISVPNGLNRIGGKESKSFKNSGMWESETYGLADRRILIKFDGGVGNFTVKQSKVEIV